MKAKGFLLCALALVVVRLVLMAVAPVFEPSEARYAAISANMARSGDFVVPHFTHNLEYQSFDGKPPLVFQAGGLFCKVFGVCEFAVRLFPFLSALLVLAILYRTVRLRSDAETGWLAVGICATSTAFYAAAGISMTDMTLTCCVAGALLLYRRFADTHGLAPAVGVAALLGAGMITKGPVSLVMFGLPVFVDAVVNRRWRTLFNVRWLVVAPVFFLVAVPWFVLVELRNPGSVWYFFYNENFMRFISHDYGDKYGAGREAFRGVSIVWAFVATLPWALLPVWRSLRSWRNWRAVFAARWSFEVLAFAAIVGFWCLTSRVLVYYLFPVIPLFAAGLALQEKKETLLRLMPWCAFVTLLVTCGALIGGMFFSDNMRGAATEFSPLANHYAHEFYHGRLPEYKMRRAREIRAEWLEQRKARKALEAQRAVQQ